MPASAERVARWRQQPGPMLFYPAMKQLTLDLAATSFLGTGIGPDVEEITRAFVDMVAASIAAIRQPWPGTQMARGVKGRERIVAYFSEQIPIRRAKRRRGPVLATLPRHPRGRRAALDAGYRRSHEFSDDGRARHADLVTDVLCGGPCRQSAMAGQIARRSRTRSASRPTSPRHSTISKPCRSPKWRSRRRCG